MQHLLEKGGILLQKSTAQIKTDRTQTLKCRAWGAQRFVRYVRPSRYYPYRKVAN